MIALPVMTPVLGALALSVAANGLLGWAWLDQRDDTTAAIAARDQARGAASACSDACSAIRMTWAPALRAVSAAASSRGPVPATTMRSSLTDRPPLIKACSPPAPVTPGSVQPGKGSSSSRAPLHRMRRWQC